jgi:parallel beta-helix repeat protein
MIALFIFTRATIASALLVCLQINSWAAVYYVAANGSDFNDGLSIATPFQSINKINTLTLQAGDQVLFRRGDVFRGQLELSQSGVLGNPIVIDAYGLGDKPVLSGATVLTNWINTGGNIWQAEIPQTVEAVTGVFLNSISLPLGRFPNPDDGNLGYQTILAHEGNTQITSLEPFTVDWTGAEVVMKTMQWVIDRSIITAQSGDVITFTPTSYEPQNLWGYFIQNHPATLDEEGEWYYDPETQIISIYSASGDLENSLVEATIFDECIRITGSHINIRNMQIEKSVHVSVHGVMCSDIEILHSAIEHSGEDGVWVEGPASDIRLEDNSILRVNNNAVTLDNVSNLTFRENKLKYVGLTPGRGKGSDGQYFGFRYYGGNSNGSSIVERNILDSLGYVGIDFRCSNITIKENVVSNYDMVKDDGGGIYTWNGGEIPDEFVNQRVISNIVYNAIGSTAGVHDGYAGAVGIYIDDCSSNVELIDNTVYNCSALGMMLHGANNISAQGNTVYNNGIPSGGGQFLVYMSNCGLTNNLSIHENIFFSKEDYQKVSLLQHQTNDLSEYGDLDSNYYCRPFKESGTIITEFADNRKYYNLDCWQNSGYEKDPHSQITSRQFEPYVVNNTSGTNLLANGTFNETIDGLYCWSPMDDCGTTWESASELDTGALKITPGSQSPSLCIMGVGPVSAEENYLLSFDMIGSDTCASITTYLRQSVDNYSNLTPVYSRLITTSAAHHEVLFQAPITEDDASIVFELSSETGTVWLDNIRLMTADVTLANPSDSILFFCNETTIAQSYSLPSGIEYMDVRGEIYSGTITLVPFTSIILLYNGEIPIHVDPIETGAAFFQLYPNPAQDHVKIHYGLSESGAVEVTLFDAQGRAVLRMPRIHQSRGEHDVALDTKTLTNGVYALSVNINGASTVQRLVVNH